MDKHTLISSSIEKLKERLDKATRLSSKYNLMWKTCQFIIAFIGVITPLIVIYRKDSIFPQQFWVMWCIATPLLSTMLSFLVSYFNWQHLSSHYHKESTLTANLIDRAENKLAFTEENKYQEFQDWLYEERQKIDVIVS